MGLVLWAAENILGMVKPVAFPEGVPSRKIFFVTPEVELFVKIGGLAEMVGVLLKDLTHPVAKR